MGSALRSESRTDSVRDERRPSTPTSSSVCCSSPSISRMFRYAICNETFQDWPLVRALAFAREAGYTGIEIAPFTLGTYAGDISTSQRDTVRRQAAAAGLEVVGLHWLLAKTEGFYLTSPEAVIRKKTADYFGELVRLCRDLGGSIMVLGSPKQRNLLPGVTKAQ